MSVVSPPLPFGGQENILRSIPVVCTYRKGQNTFVPLLIGARKWSAYLARIYNPSRTFLRIRSESPVRAVGSSSSSGRKAQVAIGERSAFFSCGFWPRLTSFLPSAQVIYRCFEGSHLNGAAAAQTRTSERNARSLSSRSAGHWLHLNFPSLVIRTSERIAITWTEVYLSRLKHKITERVVHV